MLDLMESHFATAKKGTLKALIHYDLLTQSMSVDLVMTRQLSAKNVHAFRDKILDQVKELQDFLDSYPEFELNDEEEHGQIDAWDLLALGFNLNRLAVVYSSSNHDPVRISNLILVEENPELVLRKERLIPILGLAPFVFMGAGSESVFLYSMIIVALFYLWTQWESIASIGNALAGPQKTRSDNHIVYMGKKYNSRVGNSKSRFDQYNKKRKERFINRKEEGLTKSERGGIINLVRQKKI